ncbi:MAG: hypothetical protein FJ090_21725, partial [Deltaproteobacteria bacterium]|nr:hypothetical protein [Deltaproteobacteria bacterium]
YTVARRSDGSVVAWGSNVYGQCNVPALPGGLAYVEVAAGWRHTVARRSDGSVVAWGDNVYGQCNVPVLPVGLAYVEVAAGERHTVARRSDGSVVAWGNNYYGQCNVPALPVGLAYVEVAANWRHTVARYVQRCGLGNTYCTSKVNSLGCTPRIRASGLPSSSSGQGFLVTAGRVLNQKPGLLLYGIHGPAATPFQGGFLCVAPPVRRTPAVNSFGSALPASDCTGIYAIDMNAFAIGALGGTPHPALTAGGTVVNCQWWGRDPGFPAPNNTTLTEGLEYTICP